MANEFVSKSIDVLWDGWLNSFKTIQKVQEEVEKKTVEALDAQQQLVDRTVSALQSIEEQSKKVSAEWQENVKKSAAQSPNQAQFDKWFDSIKQIADQTQELAWKPNHILLDLAANSQTQIHSTITSALEQQQQKRDEAISKIEELTQQLKESHKQLVGIK